MNKLFSKLQKLPGGLKVGTRKLTEQKHGGEVVNFCGILLALKTAQRHVRSAKLNLGNPTGSSGFGCALKSRCPGSLFVSRVISVIAKAKIFNGVVQTISVNVVNHKARLCVHNIAMQVNLFFAAIFAYIVAFSDELGTPFQQIISFQPRIGCGVDLSFEAF